MKKRQLDIAYVRKIVEECDDCLRPVKDAAILPADTYVDEEFWEFERRAIFEREWLAVGHVSEVPNPGDYLPIKVNGEPMLITRAADNQVRVISSICQHRGHPLIGGLAEPPPPGKCLHSQRLVCPYHNWVYSLEGKLVGAPSMDQTTPVPEMRGIPIRLPEYRTEIFHGLIFVTMNPDAPHLAPSLAKLDKELEGYNLENLVLGHTFPQTGQRWNWKLHHENAMEPYHTDYVHKGYHNAVPSHLTKFRDDFEICDNQIMRTTGFALDNADLFEQSGKRRLPDLEGLSGEQRSRILFVALMPSIVMVLQPSFLTMTFIHPTSAKTVDLRRITLYSKAASEMPDFDRIKMEQFEQLKTIVIQDQITQIALQEAYESRFTPRGKLSYLETSITQLNAWVIDKYRKGLQGGAGTAA
jgi:phenylpropionate dioxygenase-like ring-hydroxylating dioxygenase large terminal subunit